MKLIITGFMGAGKSTLFNLWKEDFPQNAFDLDELICEALHISPNQLGQWIEENGFSAFRKRESACLEEMIKRPSPWLLALGGGAFHKENRDLWVSDPEVKTLFLEAPANTLWNRVKADSNRPLVKKGQDSFNTLYAERLSDYKNADFILNSTDNFPSFKDWSQSQLD